MYAHCAKWPSKPFLCNKDISAFITRLMGNPKNKSEQETCQNGNASPYAGLLSDQVKTFAILLISPSPSKSSRSIIAGSKWSELRSQTLTRGLPPPLHILPPSAHTIHQPSPTPVSTIGKNTNKSLSAITIEHNARQILKDLGILPRVFFCCCQITNNCK